MTKKTPEDWKKSAHESIDNKLYAIERTLDGNTEDCEKLMQKISMEIIKDEPDREKVRELLNELKEHLIDTSEELLDQAKDVKGLAQTKPRLLQGKEPIGYSKRDAGATHDAYYGSQSANRQLSRKLYWPLNLSDWDKEKASGGPPEEMEPVSAEGTEKYTKSIGGRTVHVIIDSRGFSPI